MLRPRLLAVAGNQGELPLSLEFLGNVTNTGGRNASGNVDASSVTADDRVILVTGGEEAALNNVAFTINGTAIPANDVSSNASAGNACVGITSIAATGGIIGDSTLAVAQTETGGFRGFVNVYRLVNGALASAQATDIQQSDSAVDTTMDTVTTVGTNQVLVSVAYFSNEDNHSYSISNGTGTTNTGVSNVNGSGDSYFSNNASGSTTVTYTFGAGTTNTQGDAMVTAVYGF